MPLIQLIVILIVIGVLLWAVNTFIPMDARVKQILNVVVILALVIWLLFFLLGVAGINTNTKIGLLGLARMLA
jgi:succinate-acetate transporter protein